MRGDPNDALDAVAALIEEMRDILANGGSDAPQAFLEAAHDAQGHISRHALTSQDAVPWRAIACLLTRLPTAGRVQLPVASGGPAGGSLI